MWIRSQNNQIIGKFVYVGIDLEDSSQIIGLLPGIECPALLGNYPSHEAAMTVLDDMQRCFLSECKVEETLLWQMPPSEEEIP